jgi:hypothetical protein
MMWKKLALIIPAVFVLSCSASKFGWKPESEASKKDAAASPYAEDFDPASLNDDDINPALDKAILQSARQSTPVQSQSAPEKAAIETIVNGFRIQLMASKDNDRADEMKKQAILKFDEMVYKIFETPYYKIRVGDCATEKEAKDLREKAIQKGFKDVMIVRSKVINRGIAETNL